MNSSGKQLFKTEKSISIFQKKNKRNKQERLAFLLTFPALLFILALVVYPLCFAISQSFQLSDGSIGIDHYRSILKDSTFWSVLWNTVKFTFIIVSLEVIVGLIVAIFLQQLNSKLKSFLRAVFMIPLLMSPVVASYEWMWLLNDQYGLVPHLFKWLGLESPLWLADPKWAFFSIVIVDMWIATPFVILIFSSALASLPKDPYESAEIDGATKLQQFYYLTLPLLKPAFLIVLIIRTMDVFRLYDAVAILTNGGPGLSTTTLSILAFKTGITFGQLEVASAIAILTIIPIFIITLIYLRVIRLNR
jgi:multiple sugar transport system permease protein